MSVAIETLHDPENVQDTTPTLRPYLLARCHELGATTYTSISNRRMMGAAIAKEQVLLGRFPVPDCFGLRFGAPDDPSCRQCVAQVMCLHMAANKTLLNQQRETRANDIDTLARAMRIEAKSVRYMQQAAVALKTLPKSRYNSAPPVETPAHLIDRTWPRRFLRERARYPILDRLVPGTVLRRPYDGKMHLVTVRDGFYEHAGEKHPTLYSVVMAISGAKVYPRANPKDRDKSRAMSNCNARRFFKVAIEEALPAL